MRGLDLACCEVSKVRIYAVVQNVCKYLGFVLFIDVGFRLHFFGFVVLATGLRILRKKVTAATLSDVYEC